MENYSDNNKQKMILNKELFPTIDLSILENEVEECRYYSTSTVYIESAMASYVHCLHDKDINLQVDYLKYEKKYLDFFEIIIEENWPCYRIMKESRIEVIENKEDFMDCLQKGLREDFAYKDDDIPFDFILHGIDCIIHVGFDLGLIIYYVKMTLSVNLLLRKFYGAGFCVE